MESKALPLSEVKASGSKGEFEALVSVTGNIDFVGDRVHPGAFRKAIDTQAPPPVVWFHQWNVPPIGETLDWWEAEKGVVIKGRLFVDDDDDHQVARQVHAAMKSREGRPPALRQFSFAYDVEDSEETFEKGARIRELKSLFPITEVGPCLRGINESAGLLSAPKAAEPLQQTLWAPTSSFLGSTTSGQLWAVPSATATNVTSVWFPKALPAPPIPEPAEPDPPGPDTEAKAAPDVQVIPAWRFPPLHALDNQ